MRDNRVNEALLHFIWRFRYFNHHELLTETGQPVWIHATGEPNTNQGPDFLHARISIGGILHEGPVELHIKTSDWHRHAHDADIHYRQVVLHVVWENDLEDPPGGLPVLVLGHRVPRLLLGRYRQWMDSQSFIPCERRLSAVDAATRTAWLQQLVERRLQQRALFIAACLEANHQDWEETAWWLIARSLGQPVNASAFEAIARSLPVRRLMRQREDPARVESLLLQQAGSLNIPLSFLRMRPAHFPTVRLAQLARLMTRHSGWFGSIRDADSPRDLYPLLQVTAAGHRMGDMIKKSLLINAFVPLLFAYGWLRDLPACRERAFRWLKETTPENNSILTHWRRLGVPVKNAADSQALLELKKRYCSQPKCLDCAIGQHLLGQNREGRPNGLPAPDSN